MPKITWLGDVDNPDTTASDAVCVWGDVAFPVGVPVAVNDPHLLGKAKHNRFFRVDDDAVPDVSFFDDPPEVHGIMPETWTNTPDDLPLKRKRGRPPKVRTNGNQ